MVRYTVVIFGVLLGVSTLSAATHAPAAGLKLRLLQGHPVVDGVYVNGRGPYRFLVDTGTTLNHLDPKLGKAIGLTASFRTEVMSPSGPVIAAGSDGADVVLGEARAGQQSFLFAGLDAVHELSPDIQGILGQVFLSRFDYVFDLRAGRLVFGASDRPGMQVPLRTIQGRPAISTSLGWLVLDSGAHGLVLFGLAGGGSSRLVTMAGSQSVGTVPRQLRINGRNIWSGDAIAVSQPVEGDVAGLLPLNLFRTIYICNSGGYVVLD